MVPPENEIPKGATVTIRNQSAGRSIDSLGIVGSRPSAGNIEGTMEPPSAQPDARPPRAGALQDCRGRQVLARVGDKWSMYVIDQLGDGTKRFTELRRRIPDVSQRMLTVTLRGLERDGIVTRTMHPVIPPRVDYALTPMGRTLLDAIGSLILWADDHLAEIDAARIAYDSRARRPASVEWATPGRANAPSR
jgi:DNA-binding HxlR family transcriptional regulator